MIKNEEEIDKLEKELPPILQYFQSGYKIRIEKSENECNKILDNEDKYISCMEKFKDNADL